MRRLDGITNSTDMYELGQTLGVGEGQGGLACCGPWGPKESDTTERLSTAQHRLLMTIPRLNALDANTTEMILRPS